MADAVRFDLRLRHENFSLDAQAQFPTAGMTGLFGPSGSGKTSLLRCLAGLERRARGRVSYAEQRWLDSEAGICVPAHRRRAACVFQDAPLFSHLDVAGNLAYARRRAAPGRPDRNVTRLLGLDDLAARRVDGLSGGERRRVAIARALLSSPSLLLLDEPLSGLDEEGRRRAFGALRTIHNQFPIAALFVSHELDELVALCDHLIVIVAGRVKRAGPIGDLLMSTDLVAPAQCSSLIDAEVAGYESGPGLTNLHFPDGILRVAGRVAGSSVRVRILARDVSLSVVEPNPSSIVNVLAAQVTGIRTEGDHAWVSLRIGTTDLLARISRFSLGELALQNGMRVHAQIKAVAVQPSSELPRR